MKHVSVEDKASCSYVCIIHRKKVRELDQSTEITYVYSLFSLFFLCLRIPANSNKNRIRREKKRNT